MSDRIYAIEPDEWWPVYTIEEPDDTSPITAPLPEALVQDYESVTAAFLRIQNELRAIYEANQGTAR